jgi:hypothetical protein
MMEAPLSDCVPANVISTERQGGGGGGGGQTLQQSHERFGVHCTKCYTYAENSLRSTTTYLHANTQTHATTCGGGVGGRGGRLLRRRPAAPVFAVVAFVAPVPAFFFLITAPLSFTVAVAWTAGIVRGLRFCGAAEVGPAAAAAPLPAAIPVSFSVAFAFAFAFSAAAARHLLRKATA